jgi:hypothetical protein
LRAPVYSSGSKTKRVMRGPNRHRDLFAHRQRVLVPETVGQRVEHLGGGASQTCCSALSQ